VTLALVVGVVDGVAAGRSAVEAATDALADHGLSLVGAFAVWQGVTLVATLAITVLAVVLFGLGMAGGASLAAGGGDLGASASSVAGALAGGVGALLVLLVAAVFVANLVALLFVQFLDVAVVLGGASALAAYRHVWTFVRDAPVSVLGYTVARALVTVAAVLPAAVVAAALGAVGVDSTVVAALATLAAVGSLALAGTALGTYHAAYYHCRTGETLAG
jgi:hypothetical protein